MGTQLVNVRLCDPAMRVSSEVFSEFEWADAKAVLTVYVTNIHGATPTITPYLQSYDPVSGLWLTIFTAAAAQSPSVAGTRYNYVLTDTAFLPVGFTEAKQVYLMPTMRLGMTHGDSDAITYSATMLRVNSNNLGI
jgi:hypothetical protein